MKQVSVPGGIKFADGTVQTSAPTGTATSVPASGITGLIQTNQINGLFNGPFELTSKVYTVSASDCN